jgi:hypothetical protein
MEFSAPQGPWKTVIATQGDNKVAVIRKIPHQGFQVTMENGVRWQGQFGETNVAFLPSLSKAKKFVMETA